MTGIQPLYARPVDDIVSLLPELDEHFQNEWFRFQDTPLETISLRRQPGSRRRDIAHQLAAVATRYTAYSPLSDAAEEICAHVQGRMGRVYLARLAPEKDVWGQIEGGIYERAVERFILPIYGRGMVEFDGIPYPVECGVWHAVDAHVAHTICSVGDQPFVFLVVDTFPEEGELPSGIDDSKICARAFG